MYTLEPAGENLRLESTEWLCGCGMVAFWAGCFWVGTALAVNTRVVAQLITMGFEGRDMHFCKM